MSETGNTTLTPGVGGVSEKFKGMKPRYQEILGNEAVCPYANPKPLWDMFPPIIPLISGGLIPSGTLLKIKVFWKGLFQSKNYVNIFR